MQIAGIDQGTTSTRILIVNAGGNLEVALAKNHRQYYPQEGWVEHDPEELVQNIIDCANAVGRLDAIGIDNQGESCLAWDSETGEALSPVIVWQDKRSAAMLESMRAEGFENETLARAGLPLDPYFSAGKLAWITQHIDAAGQALKRGTLRLGTTDAFFLDRLCGRFVTDVTTASRTSLMNLETLQWDERLCEIFGVPIECLPEIVSTTGDFGVMKTTRGAVPITASIVDQQAALYGFGCDRKGDAKITFGTGAFALMNTGGDIINKPELGLLPTVAWQLAGEAPVYALDGGIFTASSALNWAKSLGLFDDFNDINAFDQPAALESGLMFVPALAGLACPHWDTRARGVWLGLSLDHKPEQLVQSILEGIAFRAAEVVDAMNDCVNINEEILIDGGMSRNPYFVQFLADVTGREMRPATMPELTGLGAIRLAAHALDHELAVSNSFDACRPQSDKMQYRDRFTRAIQLARQWPPR